MSEMIPLPGGMTLLHNTPPGTCPQCAVKHEPEQPHNPQSLAYQYWFYGKHGRWPTWDDAMAHCDDQVRSIWRRALTERGVDLTSTRLTPQNGGGR